MPPVVKIRQFLAAKAGGNGPGTDAKVLTPLQRLKLQSRTATTSTTTPGRAGGSTDRKAASSSSAAPEAEAAAASAVDDRQSDAPGQGQGHVQDAQAAQLKLTLLQVPLLPKPAVSRPAPPADPKALLRRLQYLRDAADGLLLAATTAEAATAPANTGAAPIPVGPSGNPLTAALSPHRPGAAAATPDRRAPVPRGAPYGGLQRTPAGRPGNDPATSASVAVAPYNQQLRTPFYGRPASPYTRGGGDGGGSGLSHYHRQQLQQQQTPCLSPPSLAGLRQREKQETGGGFLTHYADPRDLSTPPPPPSHRGCGAMAATGGAASRLRGGGGGAGGSTPLSVLRSIHRLQQLQRLQREGAQLVAAMADSDGAG